jgi:hypothetical protein
VTTPDDPPDVEASLRLANEAAAAVLADLHRTTTSRPRVRVDAIAGYVRIVINDGYTSPSMWESERPQAFAEVGAYFQEQLDQDIGCWPDCAVHNVGLHAEVHEGTGVWWCRLGEHAVAPIGHLRSRS